VANPVVANLIKSGARVYNAPVGESNPSETSVAYGAAWGGNWVRVGYTKEVLLAIYESEEFDMEVDEELGPVKRRRVKENLRLETTLAELTGEYLQLAAGNQDSVTETPAAGGQTAYEETGIGGVPILTEKKWGFEGLFLSAAGVEFPIRTFIHIATAMLNGNLEFSQKSTDYVGVPIQIKALADTSQSAGQKFWLFQRVTAAAS
jgi:hypothetical protein